MKNIQIINVRPKVDQQGTYIGYSAVLKPTDHSISGNFTATNEETKEAFNNNQGWDGFKKLVINRIEKDVKNLEAE